MAITRRVAIAGTAVALVARHAVAAPGFAAGTNRAAIPVAVERSVPGTWPTSRIDYQMATPATALQLVYVNWYVAGGREIPLPGPLHVRAALELPTGQIVSCRFGGAPDVAIPAGESGTSDPLPIALAAGAAFRVRTAVSSADGSWPSDAGLTGGTLRDGFVLGTSIGAEIGSIPDAGRTVPGYGPSAVLSRTLQPLACAIVGDSGAAGAGDRMGDEHKNRGYLERALAGAAGTVNVARSGELAADFAAGAPKRLALLRAAGCDRAVVAYGSNDIAAGHGVEQVKSSLRAVWRALAEAGISRIAQCTILPRMTPPDDGPPRALPGFEAQGSTRAAVNSWLRTRPAPLAVVVDGAVCIEQNGLWRMPDGLILTDDGTHPNTAGAVFLSTRIDLSGLL
jgi:lysophospholipase L1-like esterase